MKEIISNIEVFEDFVRNHELGLWTDLHSHMEQSKKKAVRCGCPNCQKEAIGAENAWTEEAIRVFGSSDPPDHEEDFLDGYGYFDSPDLPDSGVIFNGKDDI